MHFKRLELAGFKSFADRTVIEFPQGVTAIVGPNGCGKSNLADAIRWVLGEQSAKSLRGSLMEDVIFGGSAAREPVNFAEVSLTLSNESKILPIEYEEVTVSRRLYRSGESEYLLNKNIVRLRDIQELLMGTGIGTDAYSIIEQGKMDTVLNSKPEDRRLIFEEAAGITKYKSKKEEALRRLEETEANLLRVNDILQEVKRQIGTIERQAKRAELYKAEFEKLKSLELAVASREFLLFERNRRGKEEELEALKTQERESLEALERAQGEWALDREEEGRLEELLRKNESEAVLVDDEIRKTLTRGITRFEESQSRLLSEEASLRETLSKIQAEASRGQAQSAKIRAEVSALGLRLRKLKHDEEALLGEIRQAREKLGTPLFGGLEGRPFSEWLEAKVRVLRERILALLHAAVSKGRPEPGVEEEAALDSEIMAFAGEVLKAQRRHSDEEVLRQVEGKLSLILKESEELAGSERTLLEKEKALEGSAGALAEEERALRGRLAEIEKAVASSRVEKEAMLMRLAETRLQVKAFESAALEGEMVRLLLRKDELRAAAEGLRNRIAAAGSRTAALESEKDKKQTLLGGLREKIHVLEMGDAEIRHEMDRLKDRISSAYQVDLAVQAELLRTEEAAQREFQGRGEDWDVAGAKAEIEAQREKLGRMGPVNLVAIEEHGQMRERFEFLTKQEEDLVRAKEDLHKAILKINRTTRDLFSDTFQKIQKYFSEYYRLLFGGGRAELLLMDEGDVLESGIEIVARPPGKQLQSISLLSGGEKALTAVALLFALFKVKPSPFCVLDEIDAPLDESNIDRFCAALRQFITGSQFILITHSRRTMNLADALYGITMAETGVSRVISVRFDGGEEVRQLPEAAFCTP